MNRFTGFLTRLRRTFRRNSFELQMADEMNEHIERETARRIAEGEDPEIARRHATIEFGHADSLKEQVRDNRFGHGIEELWRNIRFALRGLRKSPGFALVAVATIAIGIGAGTAVFSLVNAVLLRSLPVPDPQELRVLYWSGTDVHMRSINRDSLHSLGADRYIESVNHPTFLQLREQAGDMADVFGFFPLRQVTARSGRGAFATEGLMVSDNFFTGLHVRALRGRVFTPGDDVAGVPQVVISHAIWQREFAGDPDVVGRTLAMHGIPHTVIGVLPPGFHGIRPGSEPGLYVPMLADSPFLYVPFAQDWHWFIRLMARMLPRHTDEQLAAALTPTFADDASGYMSDPRIVVQPGAQGLRFDREAYGQPLFIMLGITGLVLLVACANVAGLSVARGATRQHEFAVRVSLGAGRGRLLAQSLTESALLAGGGGALGIWCALWARAIVSRLLAGSADGLQYDLSLDARVLGFSFAAIVVTAILAGMLPAWRASRVDPLGGFQDWGAAGGARPRLGRLLVVAQIAIALGVLAAAGVGWRSLAQLRDINPGFTGDHLVVFKLNPGSAGYEGASRVPYYDRVHAALVAVPGVADAALMQFPLLADEQSSGGFEIRTLADGSANGHSTNRQMIDEGFFSTLGIPLLQGRNFIPADNGEAPKVVIVNETFARRVFGERSPLGHVMTMWNAEWRIIGVCGDVRFDDLRQDAPPTTYFPFRQRFYNRFTASSVQSAAFAVRSMLPPAALQPAIARAVASVDPGVPVTQFATKDVLLNHNIGRERMLALLGGALGSVALLLCCLGLYGLIAFDVTRRTGEIAIRMAIGAQRRDVARPILREALSLAAMGVGVGLPVAAGVMYILASQLYGVSPFDPTTIGSVAIVLIAVALLAAGLPAWRATRIDPLRALRNE